jgi:hypothetical protein
MEKNTRATGKLTPCWSSGPRTAFHCLSPEDTLAAFGPPRHLLSTSAKSKKCHSVGVLARIMYLTPGILCTHATRQCLQACLGHCSGLMQMPTHAACRDRRTALYLQDPKRFVAQLVCELHQLKDEARLLGLMPAARLNGSSDIAWEVEHPELLGQFPDIAFFDYTKNPSRMETFLGRNQGRSIWPNNYYLTFSAAPGNHAACRRFLGQGGTVAAVFYPELPDSWQNHAVTDGDAHDARFLDEPGVVIGLRAKGLARHDRSGFTIWTDTAHETPLACSL